MTDKPATKPADKPATSSPLEAAQEVGYLGTAVDQTPNEAYTVAGVTSGAPTPETQEPGTPGSTKVDPDKPTTGTTSTTKG
jgi:hypothetical protein